MRVIRHILVALVMTVAVSEVSSAQVDPAQCTVAPADMLGGVLLSPNHPILVPAANLTVTVRDVAGNPVPNAVVTVHVNHPAILLCPSTVLVDVANASGVATLRMGGGGCVAGVPGAVTIEANGIQVRAYDNAKSPDFDGAGPDGTVGLSDLISFSAAFSSGGGCHDYDNTGSTDIGDLIIFSTAFVSAAVCN